MFDRASLVIQALVFGLKVHFFKEHTCHLQVQPLGAFLTFDTYVVNCSHPSGFPELIPFPVQLSLKLLERNL